MKKTALIKAGLALAAAMVVMTGCGNKAETATTAAATEAAVAETKSEEELVDEASIKLGEYKGLTLTYKKTEITEDYVEGELEYLAGLYPVEITGRPAKLGDVANIDYVGYKDGVAFDGGTAAGYDLSLGSGTFIDGFEDGIVGMEIGEERDLNLTFPEAYQSAELAGQEVVFHVTLNSLSSAEDTKIDDELAKRVMEDDSATLEMLREDVRKDLMIQAEADYYSNGGAELISQIIANSEIKADPDAVEKTRVEMTETYTSQAEMFGFTLEEMLSYFYGMSLEDFNAYAEEIMMQEMIMDEIARLENLELAEDKKELVAQMNGFTSAAEMLEMLGEESCSNVFGIAASNYFLLENAVYAGE